MTPTRHGKNKPISRMGWHRFYVNKFNKKPHPDTEQMALWYLLLHLAFDPK